MNTIENLNNHSSDTITTNPLLLPEILLHLGYFLTGSDLINAILVNRTWHSILQRYVWFSVDLPTEWAIERMPESCPSRESIRYNCHFIRKLVCPDLSMVDCLVPGCTNLIELDIKIVTMGIVSLLSQNANSLKSLKRIATVHQPARDVGLRSRLFTVVALLTRLEDLWLERLEVHSVDEGYNFLVICQRLSSLRLSTFIWNLPYLSLYEFTGIQWLTLIKNKMAPMQELEFVSRCTNVRFFRWQTTNSLPEGQAPRVQSLLNSRLRYLRTLAIPYTSLSDADIAVIITSLPALVNLHAEASQFGILTTRAIVNSKRGIQELDIRSCEATTSEMIQEILSTCEDLETFGAGIFDMKDLARGPWVCERLSKLHISIMTTSTTDEAKSAEHERMYGQLAYLTKLEVLDLGDSKRAHRGTYDWFNLTLSSGLWRLKTLHKLESLTVHEVLGKEEQEWICDNFPNVEILTLSITGQTFYCVCHPSLSYESIRN
ncbi:hypothetical protein BGX21_005996 [Mortierella sp. AD011]|nr:hypothetical protein BGX20_000069 [Mortierella sp. AD010]KAF9399563.1 hypothetical protein BGX21_005996 [Mortierella sp. AD011]